MNAAQPADTEADWPDYDRAHLENSRQLPWDRTSNAARWEEALDFLLENLEGSESRQRARRANDRQKLRDTLGAMVLGLYTVALRDAEQWAAYSRRDEDYGPGRIYVPPSATTTNVTTSAEFLVRAGLAEHKRGSYRRGRIALNPKLGLGYQSRLRATPALLGLLEGSYGLSAGSLGYAAWMPLVRLKAPPEVRGGPKRLVRYKPTEDSQRMTRQLHGFNRYLSGFSILPPPEAQPQGENSRDEEDATAIFDRATVRLYRVFNNRRWDHGGRFYGGWWQSLSKLHRAGITMDGEPVVELDFRSLHPRLCYHLSGIPLPPQADPYVLEGVAGPQVRDLTKRAFNQLLNIGKQGSPRAPRGVSARLPRGISYRALVSRIETEHAAIGPWFRSQRGVELQHIDSEIAALVLERFQTAGICCLPVHDSFIVPRSAEAMLGDAMRDAYISVMERYGVPPTPPIITGWSAGEV